MMAKFADFSFYGNSHRTLPDALDCNTGVWTLDLWVWLLGLDDL
jgi:hypothetical protein